MINHTFVNHRCMSPECLSGEPYNMKADTYTFSIVLWEMLSGQQPYSFARKRFQLIEHVVNENGRPKIHCTWPQKIKSMLKSSPSEYHPVINAVEGLFSNILNQSYILSHLEQQMVFVQNTIKKTLASLRGGDNSGLTHSFINRRRSCESMLAFCLLAMVAKETI